MESAMIKISVVEADTHSKVTVLRNGAVSCGLVPNDSESDDDIKELVGDASIVMAAAMAWRGQDMELTDEELEADGGGFWSAP